MESSGRLLQSPNTAATANNSTEATIIRRRVSRGPPSSRLGDAMINDEQAQQNAAASAETWKGNADTS